MKKILIVEDVQLNVDLLIQLLEDDYELIIAKDGAEGVEMTLQEKPDLILMDMALPVMDGWDATHRIKSDKTLRHIPVLGISSHAMAGDSEKALRAGCDDYLTKPLDEELLFQKLGQYLTE